MIVGAAAQTRYMYMKGESVHPAYEGWWPNPDGSFTMFFGYMNSNWEEEFDVPVGPANTIEPGGPDQGQPTHFYPRRNPFLFTIQVPKDFGTKELIWTLTTHGKTLKAYASLKSDYQIDPQTISTEVGGDGGSLRDELRTNIPPELKVEGEKRRTVKVGQPLPLAVVARDPDNIPARRAGRGAAPATEAVVYRPQQTVGDVQSGWPAVFVARLSRQGVDGGLQSGTDEDVDRFTRLRQLAVVAAVHPARAAAGQPLGGDGHVRGAGHLRAARRGQRRISVYVRQRHRDRYAVISLSTHADPKRVGLHRP